MPKSTPSQNIAATSLAKRLLESQDYQTNLQKRLEAGILPPAVEAMLWHYAYGKPIDNLSVTHTFMDDLEELSDSELDQLERELLAMPVKETVQ